MFVRKAATWLSPVCGMLLACSVMAGEAGPPQTMIDSMKGNVTAFKEYMLNCGGCHRMDGQGIARQGVPSFVDSVGLFARLSAGREYLIRLPGSADSLLDDTELARVLNWMLATYSPQQLPADFKPFTAAEVSAVRPHPYDDVAAVRQKLEQALARRGLTAAPYLYGSNTAFSSN